jgi:hypothetical protein
MPMANKKRYTLTRTSYEPDKTTRLVGSYDTEEQINQAIENITATKNCYQSASQDLIAIVDSTNPKVVSCIYRKFSPKLITIEDFWQSDKDLAIKITDYSDYTEMVKKYGKYFTKLTNFDAETVLKTKPLYFDNSGLISTIVPNADIINVEDFKL